MPLLPGRQYSADTRLLEASGALVSQLARTGAKNKHGIPVEPCEVMGASRFPLESMLELTLGRGSIIAHDLQLVGPDMSNLSLDDLLHFKERYGNEFGEYRAEIRSTLATASALPDHDRQAYRQSVQFCSCRVQNSPVYSARRWRTWSIRLYR